jgi:periplasmic divalent cation tolerance protein
MKVVLTNVPPADSERIARALVEERLAACANWFAVRSAYRWKGQTCLDDEHTMLLKVAADRVEALRARLLELHPYELPEFVVLDVDAARSLDAYVAWVRAGSRADDDGG